MLKQLREKSDYDDFYIASKEQAQEQFNTAKYTIEAIEQYLTEKKWYAKSSPRTEVILPGVSFSCLKEFYLPAIWRSWFSIIFLTI